MFGYFEQKVGEVWNVLAPLKTEEELFFGHVEAGRMQEVEICLTQKHMSPSLVNEAGNTLLHVACFTGRQDIAKRLIDAGASPNTIGSRGNTCVHYAAKSGNQALVDMLISYGASVAHRNAEGKNAYDVANGFSLKQHLMKLVLAEEQRTGTAPVLSGVTRDMSGEEERLRNLPPPPTFGEVPGSAGQPPGGSAEQDPNYRPNTYTGNRIKEDGFVTTVGNPELSAKYGNTSSYRPAETTAQTASTAVPPPTFQNPNVANTPFARGRYVSYDVQTGAPGAALVAPPTAARVPAPFMPQAPGGGTPAFFNPGNANAQSAASGQQSQQLNQPGAPQQQPGVANQFGQQAQAPAAPAYQVPQPGQTPGMPQQGMQSATAQPVPQQLTGSPTMHAPVTAVAPPPSLITSSVANATVATSSPKRSPVSFAGVLPNRK